jgi:predicted ATPase
MTRVWTHHLFLGGPLLRACADRPLVVVVDDLHWADRASRELFGYLARVRRGGSILMIGTYRDDELHRARNPTTYT